MLLRSQGQSTLVAALGPYDLMLGEGGTSVVIAATDERQAGIVFKTAARMVELNADLSGRVLVFKDRLCVPERAASFVCLPAEPKRPKGLDFSLCWERGSETVWASGGGHLAIDGFRGPI